jgi:CoA:oxalate CoA-transferase
MDRPLSGVRIIGLEQYIAGPYCTMLLADAGAEVIKIERPGPGDPRRAMPPFVEKDGIKKAAGFMGYNRNKKSLALDLRKPV